MNDIEKMLLIAQTYYYFKGKFTAKQLYDFLQIHNFKIHTQFTTRAIGVHLTKSNKFNKIETTPAKYEVVI